MDTTLDRKPVPPSQPSVDRVTGKVSGLRAEDEATFDQWTYSEDPFEGRFNDFVTDRDFANAKEFNKR